MTWYCKECGVKGEGEIGDDCPACGSPNVVTTEQHIGYIISMRDVDPETCDIVIRLCSDISKPGNEQYQKNIKEYLLGDTVILKPM